MTEKKTALIVDDSQAIRHYLNAILANETFFDDVVQADSADEAIRILDSDTHSIGWVFSDWELSGTPSQALLDFVRERHTKEECRFVALTKLQEKQLRMHMFPDEVNEYVTKPFEPNILLNTVRRQLGLPERRVAARVSANAPYELNININDTRRGGEIINISTSGCLIVTQRFLQGEASVYDMIGLELTLLGEALEHIDAEIVRIERHREQSVNEKSIQLALTFLDVSEANQEQLAAYINACDSPQA